MSAEQVALMIRNNNDKITILRNQAVNGDKSAQNLLISGLKYLLNNPNDHLSVYKIINDMLKSGEIAIIQKLNNQMFDTLIQKHINRQLDGYILLWSTIYNGKTNKQIYPNLSVRFQQILANIKGKQLPELFKKDLRITQNNISKKENQKVQFFQDFEDSLSNFSEINQSNDDIIYMDTIQVKKIKEKYQKNRNTNLMDQEINKIKIFINLKPKNHQTNEDYDNLIKWGRQYLGKNYKSPDKISLQQNHSKDIKLDHQQEIIEEVPKMNYMMRRTLVEEKPSSDFSYKQSNEIVHQPERTYSFNQQNKNSDPNHLSLNLPSNKVINKEPQLTLRHEQNIILPSKTQTIITPKHRIYMNNLQQPDQMIQIVKYQQKKQGIQNVENRHYLSPSRNTFLQSHSGNFSSPGMIMSNSKKKLSEFTSEKRFRKLTAPKQQISIPEDYILKPYSYHFNNSYAFSKFRRNCLEQNFVLYSSPILIISCAIKKNSQDSIRVQVSYLKQIKQNLKISTIYRIPKCFEIHKISKISKHFNLINDIEHIFNLKMISFPLDPCFLQLQYQFNNLIKIQQPIPITIRNFIESLVISKDQWIKIWEKQSRIYHFSIEKHIILDKNVLDSSQLDTIFRDYVDIGYIEGYSVQEYGCLYHYKGLDNIKFLIRLSLRVDNIVSLQLLASKQSPRDIEKDFMEYFINFLAILLMKLDR